MTKTDWIEVGLRLLGVYFFVTGLLALLQTIVVMSNTPTSRVGVVVGPGAEVFLVPLTQIATAAILILLKWPQREARGEVPKTRTPMPAYLEESLERMEGGDKGPRP